MDNIEEFKKYLINIMANNQSVGKFLHQYLKKKKEKKQVN